CSGRLPHNLLVLPPSHVVPFLCLEDRVDVSAPRENVTELSSSHVVERGHVPNPCSVTFPPHDPVDVIIEPEPGNRVSESKNEVPRTADQTRVQELQVRICLHELLKRSVRVVLQHPLIPQSRWLGADVQNTVLHLWERVPKHFHVGTVHTPNPADLRIRSEVLVDRLPALEVRVNSRLHLHELDIVPQRGVLKLVMKNDQLGRAERPREGSEN